MLSLCSKMFTSKTVREYRTVIFHENCWFLVLRLWKQIKRINWAFFVLLKSQRDMSVSLLLRSVGMFPLRRKFMDVRIPFSYMISCVQCSRTRLYAGRELARDIYSRESRRTRAHRENEIEIGLSYSGSSPVRRTHINRNKLNENNAIVENEFATCSYVYKANEEIAAIMQS